MKKKIITDREVIERILSIVEKQAGLTNPNSPQHIYDNKALMALLNIKDKYLKKLRDNGYLGYSREGDKYWYTQEDVDRFLPQTLSSELNKLNGKLEGLSI